MREHGTRSALSAAVVLLLAALPTAAAAQTGEQEGPPPLLLLSTAQGYYQTAVDKVGRGLDATQDFNDAIEYFNKYLVAVPSIPVADSFSVYAQLADSFKFMNQFDRAIPYYLWILDRKPEGVDLSSYYLLAGYALWQTKGMESALPYYISHVEMQPEDFANRKTVARALYSQNKNREALPHYMYLIRQQPNDPEIVDPLLSLRSKMQIEYEPITLLLAELRPDTPKYLLDLGEYYLGRLDVDKAIEWLRKYTQKVPDDITGWARIGDAYRRKGDTDQALASLRKIKSLDPKNVQARAEIAAILLDRGQLGPAITELKSALAIDAEHPQSNFVMGEAAQKWISEHLRERWPNRPAEKLPYNVKKLYEETVKAYYEKARRDPQWKNPAINQLNYISQFYPQPQDIFMATQEEKTPLRFPPPSD